MKQITAEDVRLLQKETGEGMMACKKILVERYKAEEKKEMLKEVNSLYHMDKKDSEYGGKLRDILLYLVRNA